MQIMKLHILIITVVIFVMASSTAAVVTIENNGYRGLVVAIHNNITEDLQLLENIKTMLTKASSYLHHVTRRRSFIQDVTIVIPSSWTRNSEYKMVHGGDQFEEAEVRIDAPNPAYGNEPYTLQPGECGEPGKYIHMTPEFLIGTGLPQERSSETTGYNPNLNERSPSMFSPYGDLAPVFVHEWAHLRYGVFDEHGVQNDELTPLFYFDDYGKIRPNGCPKGITGVLGDQQGSQCHRKANGLPNEQCIFYPNFNTKKKATATKFSIMYIPGVDLADGFCDDDSDDRRHNPIAPNKQNLMCQGRSTWDVVSKHPDFVDKNKNSPRDINNTTPTFRFVQPKYYNHTTVVLVLDLSSSMSGRRMELLHAACTRFIKFQLVADASTLGIIGFSDRSHVLAKMTLVTETSRKQLLNIVPKSAIGGYTGIGNGLLEALNILRSSGENTEGARLILLSDGEENRKPNVIDTLDKIKQSGVIVTTIALGKQASDKLEELVKLTGGNGYFYDDQKSISLNGLDSSFAAAATVNAPIELQPIEISNRNNTLNPQQELESNFQIDKELGKDTMFVVSSSDTQMSPDTLLVTLWSPSGKKYDSKSSEFLADDITKTFSFRLSRAENGKWKYSLKNKRSTGIRVSTVISSEVRDFNEQPIRIRSWVSDVEFTHPARVKVYADVKKGYAAVLDALVTAIIYRPEGNPHSMILFDNGIGADNLANDGIYSGYFAKFSGSGRYSIETNALSNGQAKLQWGKGISGSTAPMVPIITPEKEKLLGSPKESFSTQELLKEVVQPSNKGSWQPVDDFERFATAGSFKLNNWKNDKDLIPPSRVNDLKVLKTNLSTRTVSLRWTAPGDDYDDGMANFTEVRYHQDPLFLYQFYKDSLIVNETMLINSSLLPVEPKTQQTIVIQLPAEDELQLNVSHYKVFFVVQTRDKAGNWASASNLAVAQFDVPSEKMHLMQDEPSSSSSGLATLVIVSCIAVILVIVAVVIWKTRSWWLTSRRERLTVTASMNSLNGQQNNVCV